MQDFYLVYLRRNGSDAEVLVRVAQLRAGGIDSAFEQASFLSSDEYFLLVSR